MPSPGQSLAATEVPGEVDLLPTGADKGRAVRAMFDAISGRYDLLNRLLTGGLDVGWRRRAVRTLDLPLASRVIDVACGTGDLCRELTKAGYAPVGVDFSAGMLAHARTSVPLVQADAAALPVATGSADGVITGFALRNFVELGAVFTEIARTLRVGGRMVHLEVGEPASPLLRAGHRLYFGRVVPLVGGLLSDARAYRYLPRSVEYLPPTDELHRLVADAGFHDVRESALTGGIARLLVATRR